MVGLPITASSSWWCSRPATQRCISAFVKNGSSRSFGAKALSPSASRSEMWMCVPLPE